MYFHSSTQFIADNDIVDKLHQVLIYSLQKNHEFLKSIGADVTIDYKDPDVTKKLKEAVKAGGLKYAFDSISENGSTGSLFLLIIFYSIASYSNRCLQISLLIVSPKPEDTLSSLFQSILRQPLTTQTLK